VVNVLQTLSTPSSPQLGAPARSDVGAPSRSSRDDADSIARSNESFDALVNNAADDTRDRTSPASKGASQPRDTKTSGLEPDKSNPDAANSTQSDLAQSNAGPSSQDAANLNGPELAPSNAGADNSAAHTNPLITLAAALENYVDATRSPVSSTPSAVTAGAAAGQETGATPTPSEARAVATPIVGTPTPNSGNAAGSATPPATTLAPTLQNTGAQNSGATPPVTSAPVVATPVTAPATTPPGETAVPSPVGAAATPINANSTVNTGTPAFPAAAEANALATDASNALKANGEAIKGGVSAADLKNLAAKNADADTSVRQPNRPANERTPDAASDALAFLTKKPGAASSSNKSAANTTSAPNTIAASTTGAKPASGTTSATKTGATPTSTGASSGAGAAPNAASTALPEPILESADTARIETQLDSARIASDSSKLDAANAMRAPERAAGSTRAQAPDLAAFAMRFAKQAANGARRFEIRLDPAELGRVDVRVEINNDGVAHARLLVERPEALAELMRHARSLEREMAEAGIDLADDGLKFELAEDSPSDGGQTGDAPHDESATPPTPAAPEPLQHEPGVLAEIDTEYGFSVLRRGRMDVRV